MFRILRSAFVPGLIILGISTGFLFAIKYKVQNLSKEIRNINSQIVQERENIHVLNAEISYLANPKRIKNLTDQNLKLITPKREQIITLDTLKLQLRKHAAQEAAQARAQKAAIESEVAQP